jgi:hypothetical protein
MRFLDLTLPALIFILQLLVVGLPQTAPTSQTTIHVDSSLALVDVITQDAKTVLPLKDLKKREVRSR